MIPWTQVMEFTLCTVCARAVCLLFILACQAWLVWPAKSVDILFAGHASLQLFFVMIVCPLLLNILQAFIQDHVLAWRGNRNSSSHTAEQGYSIVQVAES
jgi:STIMATE family